MADIIIDGLCKAYGGKPVLRDFRMTLPAGEITCLMGPSGIGKTTLLRILAGLETPDSGRITGLDGLRPGAVFQENRLLDWLDAAENIRLVGPDHGRVMDALRDYGLGSSVGQPVRELSGGMRRRVALLRALLSPADLLLLDEPFNGLDEATRAAVIRETRRLIDGRTTLLITHDPDEAEMMGAGVVEMGLNRGLER